MEEETLIKNRRQVPIILNPIMDDLGAAPSFCPYRDVRQLYNVQLLKDRDRASVCKRDQSCARCIRENTELSTQ